MTLKSLPFLIIGVLTLLKFFLMVVTARNSFEISVWFVISLGCSWSGWAYWKGKNMLSPPNFDYKNGTNEPARLLFIVSVVACYSIGFIWG